MRSRVREGAGLVCTVSASLLHLSFEVLMCCWAPAALVPLVNQSIGVAESEAKPVSPISFPPLGCV